MKFHRSPFTLMLLVFAAMSTFAADAGEGGFRSGELWMDDNRSYSEWGLSIFASL